MGGAKVSLSQVLVFDAVINCSTTEITSMDSELEESPRQSGTPREEHHAIIPLIISTPLDVGIQQPTSQMAESDENATAQVDSQEDTDTTDTDSAFDGESRL